MPSPKKMLEVDLTVCPNCLNKIGVSKLNCNHPVQQENVPFGFLWNDVHPIIGGKSNMSPPSPKESGNSLYGVVSPKRPPLKCVNLSPKSARGSFNVSTVTFKGGEDEKSLEPVKRARSYTLSTKKMGWPDFHTPFTKSRSLNGPTTSTLGRHVLRHTSLASGSSTESLTKSEEVSCLMPNGAFLEVMVSPDEAVSSIKQVVVNTATTLETLPLRGCLDPDSGKYRVSYIGHGGCRFEVHDETKNLRELKPFHNVLKFSYKARRSDNTDQLNFISKLIGKNLNEYSAIQNCEVNEFRWKMKSMANEIAQERRRRLLSSWQDKICYQYPPRITTSSEKCLQFVKNSAVNGSARLFCVIIEYKNFHQKIEVDYDETASTLIRKLGAKLGFKSENFCFKAMGEDSYIIGHNKVINFEFIYEHLREGVVPRLAIVKETSVKVEKVTENVYILLEKDVTSTASPIAAVPSESLASVSYGQPVVLSTDIIEDFSILVESMYLSPDSLGTLTSAAVGIRLGLYHGSKLLCPTVEHMMKYKDLDQESVLKVQKNFTFEISTASLPRMTKLCIGIFEKRRSSSIYPLFWVNSYVFDYKSSLRWRTTLHMWRYSTGDVMPTHEGSLVPLHHSVSNPDVKEASTVVLCFGPYLFSDINLSIGYQDDSQEIDDGKSRSFESLVQQRRIEFPKDDLLCDLERSDSFSSVQSDASQSSLSGPVAFKLYGQELKKIADRDPLYEITVQEKDLIWKLREHCRTKLPNLLPRVVDCVDYSDPEQVKELHLILMRWPILPVERALELLDYAYPDQMVRRFAVSCLRENATDNDVLLYLLQLVQALKHEPVLISCLVEFLLERALNNQHIGHYLFWELRAEMNNSAASLLFGLILETYLKAAPEHAKLLSHQITLLEKCKATANSINKLEMVSKNSFDRAKTRFNASLRNQFCGEYYKSFVNPLNPNRKCGRLRLPKCKLMNSKMRPQMLVFENNDFQLPIIRSDSWSSGSSMDSSDGQCSSLPANNDIIIMFKKGDDLRQDKLTLQLLTVMDRIWKDAEMDLRMEVYGCMATEKNEGLIDVVQDAVTICKIQMNYGVNPTSAVRKRGLLLSWLKDQNESGGIEAMAKAQEQFTNSCAGYSVACYVLGIGDRHNDNIMIKPDGQMFHIDFGHILGNFKHKFGIRRERVPLMLSSEFIDIIRTTEFGRQRNFEKFRNLCERAYLALRRHSYLLISLLTMMISTGLPELSSEQDLNIIRNTLNLEYSEDDALEYFRREFDESLRNDWKISVDWWCHMMNQARTS